MKLNAKAVAALRYSGKPTKHYDGHGLYLYVTAKSKTWRYSFRLGGKASEYSIGDAKLISLKEARVAHVAARKLVGEGINPSVHRALQKEQKLALELSDARSMLSVKELGNQWLDQKQNDWASSHYDKQLIRVNKIPAWFQDKRVVDVTPDDIVKVIKPLMDSGHEHKAHKLVDILRHIFELAWIESSIGSNPVAHPRVKSLVGKRPISKNYAFISDERLLGGLLHDIDCYEGFLEVQVALQLLPHLFVRPSELRGMTWCEVDFGSRIWKISELRMKNKKSHWVPMSSQVTKMLTQHRERAPSGRKFVFQGKPSSPQPISNMTLGIALKRMGYGNDVIVPHGFRHTASTFLNDGRVTDAAGDSIYFNADAIERQMGHVQGGVRGVYNKAEKIQERITMMQAWSDYLNRIKISQGSYAK